MDNKKTFQFFLTMFFMAIVIYTIYATFFVNSPLDRKSGSKNPNELALDTIVIDVQGGEFRFLKADISFEATSKRGSKVLKANEEQIRRLVLNLASKEDGRGLLSEKNKELFKSKVQKEISLNFGIKAPNIYFRNFVLAK